ncbi:MSCRAMM family adhesin SdrC [Haloprofundus salinisoli]|uniref:MSCRAMM family adhesin SdrC n=1 Tax=Haloprofundus salinisoli TaxID=2876193 RepID=UPI001CCD8B0C|nr:MSCRAMM family adhesin SdrC [Haloprofundus salinisoli]
MSSRLRAGFTVFVTVLVVLGAFAPMAVSAHGTDSESDVPTISGRLVSADGGSLSGDDIEVMLSDEEGPVGSTNVTTGDDGQFTFESNSTASHQLAYYQRAEDGSYGPRDGVVDLYTLGEVGPNEETDFGDIELPEGHVLDIQVVDEDGEPVEDASVRVYHDRPEVQEGWSLFEKTNAEGMFDSPEEPSGVEVAGDVLVYVEGPDGLATSEQSLTVTEDRTLTVTLDTPTTISGRLVTEDGEPITNRVVHHDYWDESARDYSSVRTDEDGHFTVAGVADARNQLTFFQSDGNSEIISGGHEAVDIYTFDNRDLTERSEDVDLGDVVIPEGHALEVKVVNEDGNPVENAIVDWYHNVDCIDCSAWIQQLTDSDGRVSGELTGDIKIGVFARESVTGFDSELVWKNVTVTEDRSVTVVLESPGGETDDDRTDESAGDEQSGDNQSADSGGDNQSDESDTETDDQSVDDSDDTANAPSGDSSTPPQTDDADDETNGAGPGSSDAQSENVDETTTTPPPTTTPPTDGNETTETENTTTTTVATETATPQTETTTSEPDSLVQTTAATPDKALTETATPTADAETDANSPTTETTFPGFGPHAALLAALTAGLLLARRR